MMRTLLHSLLNSTGILQIRRNHALEHATIHLLSARYPRTHIVGRSDHQGFFIYGHVSTEAIKQASEQALARLRAGERNLAVHPNCGTSFLTAGSLTAVASFLALNSSSSDRSLRQRLERLPMAILAALAALIVAQPLGRTLQRHVTTSASVGSMQIIEVVPLGRRSLPVHRVLTRA